MSARVQDSLAVLIQQQQEILTALQELARIIEEDTVERLQDQLRESREAQQNSFRD
jgi:mannitol/fructose-specific phosphotransferase system IIA component (Ntr-type)